MNSNCSGRSGSSQPLHVKENVVLRVIPDSGLASHFPPAGGRLVVTWYSEFPGCPPRRWAVNTNLYLAFGSSAPGRVTSLGEVNLVRILSWNVWSGTQWDWLTTEVLNKDQRYVRPLPHNESLQSFSSATLRDGFIFASQLSLQLEKIDIYCKRGKRSSSATYERVVHEWCKGRGRYFKRGLC